MGRRIGFLLANVYQGSSLAMWHSIAKEAKREKDSTLFVFPGGRLRYAHDNEYLRNSIYDLANGSSLDGAIIWASTLSGEVDAAEAEAFALEKSQEMPVVAIGTTIDGCPSVNFDAYTGMKDEIVHLIKVHNDRKIACRIFFAIAARGAGWIHGQSGPGKAGEAVATEWPKADNRKSRVR